jgi:HEPN domain-containing protein
MGGVSGATSRREGSQSGIAVFNREERHHSIVQLLNEVQKFAEVPKPLAEAARELDRHYIQTRYPNGFAEGYPAQYYDEKLANEGVSHARNIIEFANRTIA